MTIYSRQDVLRILDISSRQLQGWERAGLIAQQQSYSFQDLGQLRALRILRENEISSAAIRHSIVAMKAVSGMANPLLEACLVHTGARLAFRHRGAIMEPISRQLVFDFEQNHSSVAPALLRRPGYSQGNLQDMFLAAVEAEESGDKHRAMELYHQVVERDAAFAPALINLGTIYFHLRQYQRAEELYRRATEADPGYVLAFFDLGNVLDELQRIDESIAAYRRAVELSPRYADAHYNLALAHERKGERRAALRHWQAYLRLDKSGPWADHAHGQIRKLLSREKLAIVWRAEKFLPPRKCHARLRLA